MNENRSSIFLPVLVILLVIIFMIPIAGMIVDPSDPQPLETPIYELNNHSLNDVFDTGNEFDTYTPTNLQPYDDYNGLTLHQIMNNTDDNADNIMDGLTKGGNIVTYSYTNFIQSFTTPGAVTTSGNTLYKLDLVAGQEYYITVTAKRNNSISANNLVVRANSPLSSVLAPTLTTDYIRYSVLWSNTGTQLFIGSSDSGLEISFKDLLLIPLGTNPLSLTANDLDSIVTDYFEGDESITHFTVANYESDPDIGFMVQGEFRSVMGITDNLTYTSGTAPDKTTNVGYDYNNFLKFQTSWSIGGILSNTHIFFKALQTTYDFKSAINNTTVANAYLKIGDTIYNNVTQTDILANDVENTFTIQTDDKLDIRVNKTTYPDSASFEAYLIANDYLFMYEYDTPATFTGEADLCYFNNDDDIYINLTDLGIDTLSIDQIQYYYELFVYYNSL